MSEVHSIMSFVLRFVNLCGSVLSSEVPSSIQCNERIKERSSIQEVLVELNRQYAKIEQDSPREGYKILFKEEPEFQAELIPLGNVRNTAELTGIPENSEKYQKTCLFCATTVRVVKTYEDHSRAILSRKGQILLIPDQHYAHWFKMPLEEQMKLVEHALEMRKIYQSKVRSPLELHCGSIGLQTIFHTHLRTGTYLN